MPPPHNCYFRVYGCVYWNTIIPHRRPYTVLIEHALQLLINTFKVGMKLHTAGGTTFNEVWTSKPFLKREKKVVILEIYSSVVCNCASEYKLIKIQTGPLLSDIFASLFPDLTCINVSSTVSCYGLSFHCLITPSLLHLAVNIQSKHSIN